jgi:hypothetical protein
VAILGVKQLQDGYQEIIASIESHGRSRTNTWYINEANGSFMVDWKSTVGWWPIPYNTYTSLADETQLFTLRVNARLDDYHNYGYDRNYFISLKLTDSEDNALHGYIRRTDLVCPRIIKLLADGETHRLVLDVRPSASSATHVLVVDLVVENWILPKQREQAQIRIND